MSFIKINKSPQNYVGKRRIQDVKKHRCVEVTFIHLRFFCKIVAKILLNLVQSNNEDFGNRSGNGNSWIQYHRF